MIEHDPALTARLLKIVNSPLYGFGASIASIHQAVSIIGAKDLENLVLATAVVTRLSGSPNDLISFKNFWSRSVRCALTAKLLLGHLAKPLSAQSVFMCGLLHDIGRPILCMQLPTQMRTALALAEAESLSEDESERQILGFDHYVVGAELARLWGLPEMIAASIAAHGHPQDAGIHAMESVLVVLAHRLTYGADSGSEEASLWAFLGLPADLADRVMPEVEEAFENVFRLIYPAGR